MVYACVRLYEYLFKYTYSQISATYTYTQHILPSLVHLVRESERDTLLPVIKYLNTHVPLPDCGASSRPHSIHTLPLHFATANLSPLASTYLNSVRLHLPKFGSTIRGLGAIHELSRTLVVGFGVRCLLFYYFTLFLFFLSLRSFVYFTSALRFVIPFVNSLCYSLHESSLQEAIRNFTYSRFLYIFSYFHSVFLFSLYSDILFTHTHTPLICHFIRLRK